MKYLRTNVIVKIELVLTWKKDLLSVVTFIMGDLCYGKRKRWRMATEGNP